MQDKMIISSYSKISKIVVIMLLKMRHILFMCTILTLYMLRSSVVS